jgi:TorA maturation chaperone TorD
VSDGNPGGNAAAVDPEEAARATFYALVSRLFHAPAEADFLAEIARAGPELAEEYEEPGALRAAWEKLQNACRNAVPALVREEYETLFIGVGKAQVTPYLSAYAEPSSPDRFLVRLREQLAGWELARRASAFEMEDHVSGICDVMRWLIERQRPLAEQRAFFEDYAYGGAEGFYAAVQKAASAAFYRPVAAFAAVFFEVEKAAFEMSDLT